MDKQEIWIGLARVTPYANNNILNGAKGAFVNAIGSAENVSNFMQQVKEALENLDFELNEIEDTEEFYKRLEHHEVEEYIIELAEEVKKTHELKFGNFHTYDE